MKSKYHNSIILHFYYDIYYIKLYFSNHININYFAILQYFGFNYIRNM